MRSKKYIGLFIPRDSYYLWIILFLLVVITVLEPIFAIPGLLLFAALVFYFLRSNYKRKEKIVSYIENLNFNIDTATKGTLLNFPMPLVVAEPDGTIIWYNSSFKKNMELGGVSEGLIRSFADEINDRDKNNEETLVKQVELNGKHYQVLCNYTGYKGVYKKPVMILYFIDITELVTLKKTYADEKIASGIILIDNYEDLLQSTDDTGRQQILAEIDKKIISWLSFTDGIIKKYERDKYIFLFEHKHMKELEEKKFEILDIIKEINVGNKIPVTLSLGFGLSGKTPSESFQYAAAAIDVALGRGGDQVVVKNGDSFSFFGGKTRELEKRTKVKARVIAYALRELVDQSSSVLIMGHENADIDSLGAAIGLFRVAQSRGKDAHIVLTKVNHTIENLMTRIAKSEEYEGLFVSRNEALDLVDEKTLLIVVDTHRAAFTEIPELVDSAGQVVVIDHHRRGADYIQDTVLIYQETYASSTCELVTELLQYMDDKLKLKQLEAEALYAGIVVDTKNFTFKTGVRTFEAASFLKRHGVDTVSVKQLFQNDLDTYSNISSVVKSAEMVSPDVAISICPTGMKNSQLIAAKAADELLNLTGINAAFVLSDAGDEVYISGRSLGDINVQMILEKLGGGGHLTVAGAQLEGINLDEAKEKLEYAIIEYIKEQNKTST